MIRLRRAVPLLVAVVLCGIAAVLALLAVDARAWQARLTRDDLRFRAIPSHVGLYSSPAILPGDPARYVLGLGDALSYRWGLQLFWYSRVGGAVPAGLADLSATRIAAEERLQGLMSSAATAEERSDAANLLGVVTVTAPSADTATEAQAFERAAVDFQQAIAADPSNYAAKVNLELVLRLRKPGKTHFGAAAHGGFGSGIGEGNGAVGGGY